MAEYIFVALANPGTGLYDKESGFKISGDLVKQIPTDPYPSRKVEEWVLNGALLKVDKSDVQFFYTKSELGQMKKAEIVEIAKDWDISLTDDEGKEKSRERLLEDLSEKLGDD